MRAQNVVVFPLDRWRPEIANGVHKAAVWYVCPLCQDWIAGRSLSDAEVRFDAHLDQVHGTDGSAA
jgi:hypothetical protein